MTTNYLSPQEVAAELGVSPRRVQLWIRIGSLPATRPSERITRVARADLAAFVLKYNLRPKAWRSGGIVSKPEASGATAAGSESVAE